MIVIIITIIVILIIFLILITIINRRSADLRGEARAGSAHGLLGGAEHLVITNIIVH